MTRHLVAALALLTSLLTAADARTVTPTTPLPNRLVPVWSAPADDPVVSVSLRTGPYLFTDDLVVLPARGGGALTLRDPATGHVRRRLPVPASSRVADVLPFGSVVVVRYSTDNPPYADEVVAHDVRTGTRLWRTTLPYVDETELNTTVVAPPLAAAGGTLVTVNGTTMSALDPRTGRLFWRRSLDRYCMVFVDASGPVLTVTNYRQTPSRCDGQPERRSVHDARTFDRITDWTAFRPLTPVHATDDRAALVQTAADPARCELRSPTAPPVPQPCVDGLFGAGLSGDRLIYQSAQGGAFVLRALDVHTGATLWRRPIGHYIAGPLDSDNLPASAGFVAGEGWLREQRWPLPTFITYVDPNDGRTTDLPLDVAESASDLVGTGAGLVFARHETADGAEVTAYRPVTGPAGPGQLGGVPVTDWPDACTLLHVDDLTGIVPDAAGYAALPRTLKLPGMRFPRPNRCVLVPPTIEGAAVTVTVDWVAPTAAAAERLLDNEISSYQDSRTPTPLGQGRSWVADGGTGAFVLSGRCVLHLDTNGHPELVPALAQRVAGCG